MQAPITTKQGPPFRAEHVGSLLRPQPIKERRLALEAQGKTRQEIENDAQLKAMEDEAIRDYMQLQMDLGFRSLGDGEIRRREFWGAFFYKLEGFKDVKTPFASDLLRPYVPDVVCWTDPKFASISPNLLVCNSKIRHVGSGLIDEWNSIKKLVSADRVKELKISLPNPEVLHLRYNPGKAYSKEVYANDDEYLDDIAAAYRTELQILYDAGCRNVTIDDPNIAYFCSQQMIDGFKEAGEDIDALFNRYVKLYNDCIDRPEDMHLGIHVCRGNALSRHVAEGGYDPVSVRLFQDINADTYYLEYETQRAGGLEPLQHLPAHKNVILGVVSSKFAELENLNELKAKVFRAADFMAKGAGETREKALRRIGVSPQCGFASNHQGNLITREDMIAKLRLVRKLADEIWPGEP